MAYIREDMPVMLLVRRRLEIQHGGWITGSAKISGDADTKYKIVRNDRSGKRGSGVCALIKGCYNLSPVQSTVLGDLEIVSFDVPPYYDNNAFKHLTDILKSLEV